MGGTTATSTTTTTPRHVDDIVVDPHAHPTST
jgi:hypothetical protein